ncbi:hypothetical protein CRV24_007344 [Beauveria bassiana]|nr:hypothetical protein CRV24_007344 [Beauveria bassiana]
MNLSADYARPGSVILTHRHPKQGASAAAGHYQELCARNLNAHTAKTTAQLLLRKSGQFVLSKRQNH